MDVEVENEEAREHAECAADDTEAAVGGMMHRIDAGLSSECFLTQEYRSVGALVAHAPSLLLSPSLLS